MKKKRILIRVSGPDQKGIIAEVTQAIFQHGSNIEDIDQRNLDHYLVMNMVVDFSGVKLDLNQLRRNFALLSKKIAMKIEVKVEQSRDQKNICLLVTKEDKTPQAILEACKKGQINGQVKVMIGNRPDLKGLAKKYQVEFFHYPSTIKKEHEDKVLKKMDQLETDLVVLARYMQILSPEFVFRYEGKIINIHPSLLPAFPGPRSYEQAFNKGVEVVGVTAHFATTDLDEGPIICQESFRVTRGKDDVKKIQTKGQAMEVKALTRAVKLFCADRVFMRRGKAIFDKKMTDLIKSTAGFYR